MSLSRHILTWLCLLGIAVLLSGIPHALAAATTAAADFHKNIQPLLQHYCYECHGDGVSKGNVAFDTLKSNDQIVNHELWSKVLLNLRAGLMPKKGDRPTAEQQKTIEDWVKYEAFGIDPKNPDPGRVTLRRLNRVEYHNTILDLMGVDFNVNDELPPDDTGYGFDNIGDVLTVSPMLLERYMKAATTIVDQGVPKASREMPVTRIAGSRFSFGESAPTAPARRRGGAGRAPADTILALSYYKAATVSNTFTADFDGSYKLSLELSVRGPFGFDPGRCRVIFSVDNRELLTRNFTWDNNKVFPPFVYDQNWKRGSHQITFEVQPMTPDTETGHGELARVEETGPGQQQPGERRGQMDVRIDFLSIEGPMEEKYWSRPKNFDRFFTRDAPNGASARRQYAREILEKFASKAFRRPVDADEVNRLAELAETVYKQPDKSFEQGIGYAMVAVLASPRFIFKSEAAETASSREIYPMVDEYTLASRLSYFLWSTMPDDELFDLAAKGELRKNLPAQIQRMVEDPRSEELVDNFTGQWLLVRNVEGIPINARAVLAREKGEEKKSNEQSKPVDPKANVNNSNPRNPGLQLTPEVRHAMEEETHMAFSTLMHEDGSVNDLIECNYIFLNQPLARYYGLTNLEVTGANMRRVNLPPDSPRGGLLTEGSFLVVTSNPDRTSPVKRGMFVLDNILGSPSLPPPPNVPLLEDAEQTIKDHEPTLKESLEAHRTQPLCSSCHSRMDPIGLAFENFNALGVWREKERSQTIEAAGRLVTGESFESVSELKHIIITNHREEFYRTLATKLLTYATGRGPEYYDTETLDQIVQRMDSENGKFSVLLTGIINSAPFQKERREANPTIPSPTQDSSTSAVKVSKKKEATL